LPQDTPQTLSGQSVTHHPPSLVQAHTMCSESYGMPVQTVP